MKRSYIYVVLFSVILFVAFSVFNSRSMNASQDQQSKKTEKKGSLNKMNVVKTNEEWKRILTPEQYEVMREKGTERPFTGKYWNTTDDGTYTCAACGQVLFKSKTKFDAGCGWPSFFEPSDSAKIIYKDDYSFGMHRIEVECGNCGAHLGHVFDDGPEPSGKRYCINSVSLDFKKEGK